MGWDDAVRYAPLATPVVAATAATVAGCIALYSVSAQRLIARRRAALDIFLKTELDKGVSEAYDTYKESVDAFIKKTNISVAQFEKDESKDYTKICSCLNINELIAVGIRSGVLDEDVCYEFWGGELIQRAEDCKRVVEYCQEKNPYAYKEMEHLGMRWRQRRDKELEADRARRTSPAPGSRAI